MIVTFEWYTLIKIGFILYFSYKLLWNFAYEEGYLTAYERLTKTSG